MKLILGGLFGLLMVVGIVALLTVTGTMAVPEYLDIRQLLLAQSDATTEIRRPAGAQSGQTPPNPQGPANWSVTCGPGTGGLDCRAISRIAMTRGGQGVLTVAVRIPPETKKPVMLLLLPLGVDLPSGATLEFAGGPAKKLIYSNCDQDGCLTEYSVTAEEIDALNKGRGLTVSVQTRDGQPLSVQVPAAGFAAAYAKVK